MHGKPLTTKELKIIKQLYPTGGACACQLGGIDRSHDAITSIAYRNGIRMTARLIEFEGRFWTLPQLASKHSINVFTLRKRLKHLSIDAALTTPLMECRRHGPR